MNPTPPVEPLVYVENQYHLGFYWSMLQSFLLIFVAELGDKTFIMLIILQMKTNKITVFTSALFTQLFMNILAVFVGFAIDFLLYKNFIDWIGMLCFLIYGIWILVQSCQSEGQTFEKELHIEKRSVAKRRSSKKEALSIIPEIQREDTKYNETLAVPLLIEDTVNQAIEEVDDDDDNNASRNGNWDLKMFWVIASSIALSECGDRTQFSALTMAAIFNVYGVLIGSCVALILTNTLGVFLGQVLVKRLHEKTLNFLAGLMFFGYSLNIYLGKYLH